jgi:hypothetical protein
MGDASKAPFANQIPREITASVASQRPART